MNGLKQVSLIKSAKFDFANVNVEGNSLFIGANGAGKTTLLRAILYFYTASSQGLGISSNKKISFSDYYFEYENSYIVYVYQKDDKYVLVTVYKDGSVKFRFTLFDTMPDIKEIFIQNNKPIDTASLWLKLKELGICSNIVQNGAKYKEILYSKSHKDKMFSLFEAKDYDSFTKTLSNIFINSKVDSEAIKKVIVSSLGIDSSIDLSQIHRHLSRFNELFEDIKSYESNTLHIKKIIALLDEYEQTKGILEDDLSTLCNSKELTQKSLDILEKEIKEQDDQKEQIKTKLEYEQTLYQKRKDKLNQSKGAIDSFIKEANSKKVAYEKKSIKEKLSSYETLDVQKSKLKAIEEKKEFLTKEFQNLQKNHELRLEAINNSFESLKNSLESKIFDLQKSQESDISKLKVEESKDIDTINEEYLTNSLNSKDAQSKIHSQIEKLNYQKQTLNSQNFIYKDEDKLVSYQKQKDTLDKHIEKCKLSIELLDKDISNKNTTSSQTIETLKQNYQKESNELHKQIQNLKDILYPNEKSLINKIYKNSKVSEKYIHFLKDDILKSEIEVKFGDDTNSIFEFEPLDLDIKKNTLEKDLEKLKTKLQKLEKNYIQQKEFIEKELNSFEKKIYKEKRGLNDKIKGYQIELITCETKIASLKDDKIEQRNSFEEDKKTKIKNIQNNMNSLNEEQKEIKIKQNNLLKLKENSIKSKRSHYTKLIKKVKSEYEPSIQKYTLEIKEQKNQKEKSLQEQEELYHTLLKQNNVDTNKLKELEIEHSKLQDTIDTIQSYQILIIEYKKDKIEYIDKLEGKNQELKGVKKDIELLLFEFDKISSSLKDKENKIDEILKEQKQKQNKKVYQLQRVEEFEKTTTFNECISWGIKYIQNDKSEDLITLIGRIDNSVSKYRGYYAKVQNILGKLNSIFDNSLNITRKLDALECAYSLKEYHETQKIENTKSLLTQNLNQILKSIIEQYDKLLQSQGQIESLIKKITKIFDEIQIGVIDTLALRYQKTNNKIIETFNAIKIENEQNSLSYSTDSLFGVTLNKEDTSKVIVELLKKLIDLIEFEKSLQIDIEDSFILEFRVVENGNDSKYVPSLDMVGSNGTDVLVKSMIYVAMLHIFKQKITKKELSFQVVLDEVGILSQRYLKELIEFANKKGIVFVNGAPDEKLIGTYKQVSLISKIDKISVVKELIVK